MVLGGRGCDTKLAFSASTLVTNKSVCAHRSIRPESQRQVAKMTEVIAFKLDAQRASVFTTDVGNGILLW